MVFRSLFLSLLMMISTPALSAQKNRCSMITTSGELKDGETLNRVLRGSPRDLAENSKVTQKWLETSPYAGFVGLSPHDQHIGNISRDYIHGVARWIPIDLDDVGFGPVLAGLAKTMALNKTATKDIKYAAMTEAFFMGLSNQPMKVPKAIRKLLEVTEEEDLDASEAYAEEKSEGNQLAKRPDYHKMTPEEFREVKKAVETAFPQRSKTKFLSGWRMQKEKGGSADAYRYRVLVRMNGRKTILDIKQPLGGNLFAGIGSRNPGTHLEQIFGLIFEGDVDNRKVVRLKINGKIIPFSIRPKLEIDALADQPPKADEFETFIEVALYNLWVQGQMARLGNVQEMGKLARLYVNDPEAIALDVKNFAKNYLKEVSARWDELYPDDEE